MSDRKDWFFRQIVAEDELDSAFQELEQADRDLATDFGLGVDDANPDEFGGIMRGMDVTITTGVDVQTTVGSCYDNSGQRIRLDSNTTVTLSNIGVTEAGTGGVPDGASTDPGAGQERWATLFIVFDRVLSDQRLDGNNQTVFFERDESFHFEVTVGTAAGSVGTPAADGPPRQAGKVLLADIKLKDTGAGTFADSVDISRREVWYQKTGSPRSIKRRQLRDVLNDILGFYNDHVSDVADFHTAAGLAYGGGDPWADGTPNPASNVEAQLDKIITDLNPTTNPAGAKKIGALAQSGSLQTPNSGLPVSLSAGTLEAQLTALMDAVNGRVFRGGDTGISGALLPSITGVDLGSNAQRWDLFIRDVDINGSVIGDLVPATTGVQDLGTSVDTWGKLWADFADINTTLDVATLNVNLGVGTDLIPNGVSKVGSSSSQWDAFWGETLNATPVTGTAGLRLDSTHNSVPRHPPEIISEIVVDGSVRPEYINSAGHVVRPVKFEDHFNMTTNMYGIGVTTNPYYYMVESAASSGTIQTPAPLASGGHVYLEHLSTDSTGIITLATYRMLHSQSSGQKVLFAAHVNVTAPPSGSDEIFVGLRGGLGSIVADYETATGNALGFAYDSGGTWRIRQSVGATQNFNVDSGIGSPVNEREAWLYLLADQGATTTYWHIDANAASASGSIATGTLPDQSGGVGMGLGASVKGTNTQAAGIIVYYWTAEDYSQYNGLIGSTTSFLP